MRKLKLFLEVGRKHKGDFCDTGLGKDLGALRNHRPQYKRPTAKTEQNVSLPETTLTYNGSVTLIQKPINHAEN